MTVAEQRQQLKNGTIVVGEPKTDTGRRTISLPVQLIPEITLTAALGRVPKT